MAQNGLFLCVLLHWENKTNNVTVFDTTLINVFFEIKNQTLQGKKITIEHDKQLYIHKFENLEKVEYLLKPQTNKLNQDEADDLNTPETT